MYLNFSEFRRLCVVVSWQGREISIRKGPVWFWVVNFFLLIRKHHQWLVKNFLSVFKMATTVYEREMIIYNNNLIFILRKINVNMIKCASKRRSSSARNGGHQNNRQHCHSLTSWALHFCAPKDFWLETLLSRFDVLVTWPRNNHWKCAL